MVLDGFRFLGFAGVGPGARSPNLSIKIHPPCAEHRFSVLDEVRRGDVSFSRRVLLKSGVDAAGSRLKERHRRVSLNVLAVFVHLGVYGLKPEN
jgi:hypothetical protein